MSYSSDNRDTGNAGPHMEGLTDVTRHIQLHVHFRGEGTSKPILLLVLKGAY